MTSTAQARHFQPGEGKTFKIGRMSMTFKTTAAAGWNAYTVCEAVEPPESGAGYHRHPTYDETFIICEGRYDFRLGEKLLKLGPGDVVFVPRGTPHGFVSTGPEVGRQIIISSPGGVFDAMIRHGQPDTPSFGGSQGHRHQVRSGVPSRLSARNSIKGSTAGSP
jgi:mannose-6-phosphate isomerase-like protein (cupin superfamily)